MGHAFGNGVACWVIISGIYPTKVRGRGMSIATTGSGWWDFGETQSFPIMQKYMRLDGTFLALQWRRLVDDRSGGMAHS